MATRAVRRIAVLQELRTQLRAKLSHGGDSYRVRLLVRLGGRCQQCSRAGRRQHPRQAPAHAVRVLLLPLPLHGLESRQVLVRRRLERTRELDTGIDERVQQRLRQRCGCRL